MHAFVIGFLLFFFKLFSFATVGRGGAGDAGWSGWWRAGKWLAVDVGSDHHVADPAALSRDCTRSSPATSVAWPVRWSKGAPTASTLCPVIPMAQPPLGGGRRWWCDRLAPCLFVVAGVEPLLCGYLAAVTQIGQVVVVVPAHNERDHLPRCLRALTTAALCTPVPVLGVVVLDACHAGMAGSDAFATNDDAVSALITRAGAPIVVLAGSKGRQFSQEAAAAGGGVFTAAVAAAISEARATHDRDRSGLIDLSELYTAVKARVLQATNGRQTPWLARNALVGEMALF